MMLLRIAFGFVAIVFVLPAAISAFLWFVGDHPRSWRDADWSASAILPPAESDPEAAIYVMSARTGGLKGAVSVHSWIVLKDQGAAEYERWDVVGWGRPVRRNAYAPDGRWYSNAPRIHAALHGEDAQAILPRLRSAIERYLYARSGDYVIFPGPNSNTFVAAIVEDIPALRGALSPLAVGRDFPRDGRLVAFDRDRLELRASLFGYAGFVIGPETGVTLNLLGLVAGVDPLDLSVDIPAFGTFRIE